MPISRTALVLNFLFVVSATSANVFFGLLRFINLLEIRYYYFYTPKVIDIVIFSTTADLWIWLVSLLAIILEIFFIRTAYKINFPRWTFLVILSLLVSLAVFPTFSITASYLAVPLGLLAAYVLIHYGNGFLVASRVDTFSLALTCIAALLVLFELASASTWVLNIFNYEVPFGSSGRWTFSLIDLQLFNVLYPLTSGLFLIFLYSWIWIPLLKHGISRIPTAKHILRTRELGASRKNLSLQQNMGSGSRLSNGSLALYLSLSSGVAAFIAYYPYLHLPGSTLAGADSIYYYDWLREMMQKGPLAAFEKDRPLFNLLMYFFQSLVGSPATVIRIMPIILAASLSLAVFWFVRVGTGNERLALMSSLFSAFSFQTTVSVFAYVIANWLAIVETLLLLVFLLKYFEKPLWRYLSASTVIGITLLLTHPYTWNVVMVVLCVYSGWILLKRHERKIESVSLVFLLAANSVFYLVYSLIPLGKGVFQAEGGVLQYVTSNIGLSTLFNLPNALGSMVQTWAGGLFGNPLLMVLAIAGMFPIINRARRFNRLMLLFVMIPSLALLATPAELYFRIVYLIPIQIQAAFGLCWILDKVEVVENSSRTSETFHALKILIILLIVLFLLNYSFRSVETAVIHLL